MMPRRGIMQKWRERECGAPEGTGGAAVTPEEERLRQFGAIIDRLTRKQDISRAETKECWRQICLDEQPKLQQGAFLAALAAKPETLDEIAGTFDALYEFDTTKVAIDTPEPIIENAGTGGDTLKTFNISTGAAIVAAACGLYVARHCARAVTSNCGAVDVIEALGVGVECGPEFPRRSIEQVGICAWNGFVPWLRPTFIKRFPAEIRFGTTVNFVGPLLTPTMPEYRVMGIKSLDGVEFLSRLLRELGLKRAFVMHGLDAAGNRGMDELSTLGPSHIAELKPDGSIEESVMTPEQLGLRQARYEEIASTRDVWLEALTLLRVIAGADSGARQDIVCLNAAPLLYVMGRVVDLREGVAMARAAIQDGRALRKLRDWVTWQNETPDAGTQTLDRMLGQI
jgi:anthranilate phosphoribosyltransferase